MKHLYYLRHGESVLNTAHKWSGRTDTPLTNKGRQQASDAGELAMQEQLVFDAILTSPLVRAVETAQLFAQKINYPLDKIQVYNELVERSYGELEATMKPLTGVRYLFDEAAIDSHTGVEELADLQARADRVLAYLQTLKAQSVLVVSHGAFGRALWRSVNNKPMHYRGHYFRNASLAKLI